MGMDIFIYQPFNLKKLNSDLGYEEENTHGLKSLGEQVQEVFSQGFKIYFEAPTLFFSSNILTKRSPKDNKAKQGLEVSKISIDSIKQKIQKIKLRQNDLVKCSDWHMRHLFTLSVLQDEFWEKLVSESKDSQATIAKVKQSIKDIGQFIEFTPQALLYVANEIFPNLVNMINNALLELRDKKDKVPKEIYQEYLLYLISLKKRLTASEKVFYSEREKIVSCAFTMLQCYAVNHNMDVTQYFFKKLNDQQKSIKLNLNVNRQHYDVTDADFSALHELIIRLGGADWHQRLLELPWWKPAAEESDDNTHTFDLKLVIGNHGHFAVPAQLRAFIPDEIRQPKFIFWGTFVRHNFFKGQFLNLVKFKEETVALESALKSIEENKKAPFAMLAALASHIDHAEKVIFIFIEKINSIKINWFLALFFPKTILFFTRWRTIIDQQQQMLAACKQAFGKLIIDAIEQTESERNPFEDNLIKIEDMQTIKVFYEQQCDGGKNKVNYFDDENYLEQSRESFNKFSSNSFGNTSASSKYDFVEPVDTGNSKLSLDSGNVSDMLQDKQVVVANKRSVKLTSDSAQAKQQIFNGALSSCNYEAIYQILTALTYDEESDINFCFQEIKKFIKNNIKNIEFHKNDQLYERCLKKLSNQNEYLLDLELLKKLCLHQDSAYLSWYDERDRLKFHQFMFDMWDKLKNQDGIDFSKIKKLANYLRFWEFENLQHEAGAGKKYAAWHRGLEVWVDNYYEQIINGNFNFHQEKDIINLIFTLAYFKFYSPFNAELKSKLNFLFHVGRLWLFSCQQNKEKLTSKSIYGLKSFYDYFSRHVVESAADECSDMLDSDPVIYTLRKLLHSLSNILTKSYIPEAFHSSFPLCTSNRDPLSKRVDTQCRDDFLKKDGHMQQQVLQQYPALDLQIGIMLLNFTSSDFTWDQVQGKITQLVNVLQHQKQACMLSQ